MASQEFREPSQGHEVDVCEVEQLPLLRLEQVEAWSVWVQLDERPAPEQVAGPEQDGQPERQT